MVSNAAIAGIIFSMLVSLLLPVALSIYFAVKHKIHPICILFGALVFLVFVMLLESFLNQYLIRINSATKIFFKNPWAYAAYGGLAAGLFEESGRFLIFIFLMKKYRDWKDGVAYGIGHGGTEAFILGGLGNFSNLVYALMINNGLMEHSIQNSGTASAALEKIRQSMLSTSSWMFTVSGLERIMALTIQIALSVFLLYGISRGKYRYLLYAILLHAAVDFPAALLQMGIGSIWTAEGVAFAAFLISLYFIVKSKRIFQRNIALQ